jgi:hypothetical protein
MMNERIKELGKQAISATVNKFSGVERRWSTEEWRNFYDNKFAELIVQECANAIVNDSRLNDVRSASNGCVRTIKEHFGVKQ